MSAHDRLANRLADLRPSAEVVQILPGEAAALINEWDALLDDLEHVVDALHASTGVRPAITVDVQGRLL